MKLRTDAAGETSSRPFSFARKTSLAGSARVGCREARVDWVTAQSLPHPGTSTHSIRRGKLFSHTIENSIFILTANNSNHTG